MAAVIERKTKPKRKRPSAAAAAAGKKAERKLRNRRKRFSKGRVLRVSDLVYATLTQEMRRNHDEKLSWDCALRRLLGLPDREGRAQPLIKGILEQSTGRFLPKAPEQSWNALEEDAYELALVANAAAWPAVKFVPKPLRFRELP